jgi:hypothetical protein
MLNDIKGHSTSSRKRNRGKRSGQKKDPKCFLGKKESTQKGNRVFRMVPCVAMPVVKVENSGFHPCHCRPTSVWLKRVSLPVHCGERVRLQNPITH